MITTDKEDMFSLKNYNVQCKMTTKIIVTNVMNTMIVVINMTIIIIEWLYRYDSTIAKAIASKVSKKL
jgi:hypothetical protein